MKVVKDFVRCAEPTGMRRIAVVRKVKSIPLGGLKELVNRN